MLHEADLFWDMRVIIIVIILEYFAHWLIIKSITNIVNVLVIPVQIPKLEESRNSRVTIGIHGVVHSNSSQCKNIGDDGRHRDNLWGIWKFVKLQYNIATENRNL